MRPLQSISRRKMLLGAGGGLAACTLNSVIPARALAADPVTILAILPQTGPFAADGELIRRGQEMAVQAMGGEVLGRPINYIVRDTGNDPGVATRRVTEAVQSENVVGIVGPWADNVAQAVSDVARREKVIHYWSGGPIECHRYWFQWAPPYYTGVKATIDYVMEQNPEAKRWYRLTSDYAFGWTLTELQDLIGEEHGIEWIGESRHVLGEREFARYMGDIIAASPDVLVLNNFGLDTAQALREAAGFGLNRSTQIVVPWGSGIEDYLRLDPSITEGLVVGTAFHFTYEAARDFADRYIEAYNEPPGYPAGSGYGALEILLKGIEHAGSSEPADVIEALEGWELDTIVGRTKIDAATHQTIRPFFVTRGKARADMEDEFDLAEVVATSSEVPPAELLGCTDIGSL
jgi:branched-chain amino acid transport system substrate-binding protein